MTYKYTINSGYSNYFKPTTHLYARLYLQLKGDDLVQHALDHQLEREEAWLRQSSTIKSAHAIHCRVPNSRDWKKTKTLIKKSLVDECKIRWKEVVEPLLVQGEFMKIVYLENTDVSWKSLIYNLPQGVLKFAANAAIDSLPSAKNLYRWGKRLTDKCHLCNCTGTLHHVLNNCEKMLDRYGWRHNNLIKIILKGIKPESSFDTVKVYADIQGETINGGTIPPFVIPTQQKPDICFIDTLKKLVILFELTVPFETNIDAAHQRKEDRYAGLTHDVEKAGWKCTLICVEIGSRGLITPQNKVRMKEMLKLCNSKIKYPHMREEILKTVLFGSYVIFNGKSEPSWQIDQYLNI